MGRRKSNCWVEMTPEREAVIRARRHIKPDAPDTKPGDLGNGHVLVVDERTQKFNGNTYYLYADARYFVRFEGTKQFFLHKDVWQFHNGAIPSSASVKYYVHHEHKDEHGQWDTHCNDIEWLLLMQSDEHKSWHSKYHPLIEVECEVCHKTFSAKSKTAKYCLDCSKKVEYERRSKNRNNHREPFQTFEESSKNAPVVANAEEDIPRVSGDGAKTIRYCFFCHRPFEALISKETVTCGRPDCAGRLVVNAYEQAKMFAAKQKWEHCGGVFRFFSKKIKATVRCLFIDGEIWFVAKDVCDVLEYKNSRDALSKHVDPEDKGVAKRDTLGGPQNVAIINESGFYSLVLGSKLPSAREFKHWVTSVVLPSLRKYGRFIITDENPMPMPLPEDTTFVLVDINDQPFSFSTDERDFMQKFIPAYRQMSDDDRLLLAELVERNSN